MASSAPSSSPSCGNEWRISKMMPSMHAGPTYTLVGGLRGIQNILPGNQFGLVQTSPEITERVVLVVLGGEIRAKVNHVQQ
jgi:hypothetical protein